MSVTSLRTRRLSAESAGPVVKAALMQLEDWLADGQIRPLDLQLARQVCDWEMRAESADLAQADDRLAALLLAACAASLALGKGQVCLPLSAQALKQVLPATSLLPLITAEHLSACAVVGDGVSAFTPEQSPLLILHKVSGQTTPRLYLHRYFQYEQSLFRQLSSRLQLSPAVDETRLQHNLSELFPRSGESTDWQVIAAASACLRSVSVITGGPGTGKTTTVTRMLSALLEQNPDLRIALAAPTGKAAARMTESILSARDTLPHGSSIPAQSNTLHRLLGWSPQGFRYHAGRPLPFDCVIVDEASMIDLPMMAHLFSALAPSARLILLGDRDQLSSVEVGSVLADLCDSGAEHGMSPAFADRLSNVSGYDLTSSADAAALPMADSVVQLRHSHRFSVDSGIGELARAVNQGNFQAASAVFTQYRDVHWLAGDPSADAAPAWEEQVITGYRAYCHAVKEGYEPEHILQAFDQFQVLVALRQGPWGAELINERIRTLLTGAGLLSGTGSLWYPGRPVMISRNDYDLGLFNGDIGITLTHQGHERVVFRSAEGQLRFISPGRLPGHETAFAMTVHKSQGSEFSRVMLLLPNRWQSVITRELIYTAITRAKKEFLCQAGDACWQTGLSQRVVRASGLRDALWS